MAARDMADRRGRVPLNIDDMDNNYGRGAKVSPGKRSNIRKHGLLAQQTATYHTNDAFE